MSTGFTNNGIYLLWLLKRIKLLYCTHVAFKMKIKEGRPELEVGLVLGLHVGLG